MNNNDEYTDYSCSTSLERLARDVETILRAWHVHQGSDRHASTSSSLLLRSETSLSWNVSLVLSDGQRVSCEVPLQLDLWDGPPGSNTPATKKKPNDPLSSSANVKQHHDHLPYSLQRRHSSHTTAENLFDNFSTLFGLGQHITLTPVARTDDSAQHQYLSPAVYDALCASILSRHDATTTAPTVITSVLSGWLQTALNLAATHCRCCLPVIGVWSPYRADNASWMEQALSSVTIPTGLSRRKSKKSTTKFQTNQRYRPPLFTGHLFGPESVASVADFSLSNYPLPEGRRRLLSTWASILMQYCPKKKTDQEQDVSSTPDVILALAQHAYTWQKPVQKEGLFRQLSSSSSHDGPQDWRMNHNSVHPPEDSHNSSFESPVVITLDPTPLEKVEEYRQACREHALALLEQASGASKLEPLWGPPGDPLQSLQAIVTWTGSSDGNIDEEPLLSFPLKSRSRRMSASDRRMMEESMEEAVLDPFQHPSQFVLETQYDREMTQASLAATQRCVLAALIRTATLPTETTLQQLVDTALVEASWDHETGNVMASALADEAHASLATHSLVAAMDWKHAAEDMIVVWQAEEIVRHVFWEHHEAVESHGGSSNTTTRFFPTLEASHVYLSQLESHKDEVWSQPMYSALPGRLLSLLFVHMARVRSPSSMILVWTTFVRELRRRWDHRLTLPNMKAVPGIDKSTSTTAAGSPRKSMGDLSVPGHIEPDPDAFHCLIGQKLQVFNVCLENLLISESLHAGQMEKRARVGDSPPPSASYHDAGDEFFDAEEGPGRPSASSAQQRLGARCPVQDATLSGTGDQLFAPYLQRSQPLTTDVIAERRLMLAQQKGDDSAAGSTALRQQLEILYRLGKPKLLSDMCSFKAANPGSSLDDFVGWYKNPENPLEGMEKMKLLQALYLGAFVKEPSSLGIEKTTENLRMLEETRKFLSKTWNESRPVPAFDQEPLFDAEIVTERALDYLETLHPVNLLCQVMAVNLTMAYFTLVSSSATCTAIKVNLVQSALDRLREKIDSTLYLLSLDATAGVLPTGDKEANVDIPSSFASVKAISSCEKVCVALGETEVLVSRATSLLHKLPRQYNLVEKILQNSGTSHVEVKDATQQRDVLHAVGDERISSSMNTSQRFIPKPAVCDYLLRNTDDSCPSQLSIRYADDSADGLSEEGWSLTVALSRCSVASR